MTDQLGQTDGPKAKPGSISRIGNVRDTCPGETASVPDALRWQSGEQQIDDELSFRERALGHLTAPAWPTTDLNQSDIARIFSGKPFATRNKTTPTSGVALERREF